MTRTDRCPLEIAFTSSDACAVWLLSNKKPKDGARLRSVTSAVGRARRRRTQANAEQLELAPMPHRFRLVWQRWVN